MAAEQVVDEETGEILVDEPEQGTNGEAVVPLAPIIRGGDVDLPTLGRVLVASKWFADTRSAAQAVVKILAGRELGLGPVASMNNIHIVQGHLSLHYSLVAALIKRHPKYDFRVETLNNEQCVLKFFQREDGHWDEVGLSTFSMKDAELAGLRQRSDAWKKYPRNLLFARALTNGAKLYTPDVFVGAVYTEEELS